MSRKSAGAGILSAAEVDQYWRDGYLFPIPVLSTVEVEHYRRQMDVLIRRHGWPLDPRCRHKPHLHLHWVSELARHPRILDAVQDILGPDLLLFNSWFFVKPANDASEIAWHRDSVYGLVENDEGVTAWVALTDSTPENGCVQFAAGTHRDAASTNGNEFLRGEAVAKAPEGRTAQAIIFAGQMSLHHVRVIHASDGNRTAGMRAAVALRYLGGRTEPRKQGQQATLVRGTLSASYALEALPGRDDDPAAMAWHARSFRRHSLELLRQALRRPSRFTRALRILTRPANLRAAAYSVLRWSLRGP